MFNIKLIEISSIIRKKLKFININELNFLFYNKILYHNLNFSNQNIIFLVIYLVLPLLWNNDEAIISLLDMWISIKSTDSI